MTRIKNVKKYSIVSSYAPSSKSLSQTLALHNFLEREIPEFLPAASKKYFLLSLLNWLPSGFRDCHLVPELWNLVSYSSACYNLPPKLPPLWFCRPLLYTLLAFSYQTRVTFIRASIPSLLQISRWSSLITVFYSKDLKPS